MNLFSVVLKIIFLATFVNSSTIATGGQYLHEKCEIALNGEVVCKGNEVNNRKTLQLDPKCNDNHDMCSHWASEGECSTNPNYMLTNCKKSCNKCSIENVNNNTATEALMMNDIQEFGVAQTVSGDRRHDTLANIFETVQYMKHFVYAENPTHNMTREVVESCRNNEALCSYWAIIGECDVNMSFMTKECAPACKSCEKIGISIRLTETDVSSNDTVALMMNDIQEFGVAQTVSGDREQDTLVNVYETVQYMKNIVHAQNPTHNMTREVIESCRNNEAMCSYWAVMGECDVNPSFMAKKCAPACKSCEKLDINVRCGERDPNAVPAIRPGDLNYMFERIVTTAPGNQTDENQIGAQEKKVQENGTPFYTVHIHSHPASTSFADSDKDKGAIPLNRERDLQEDVWVITLDNFLSDEECDYMINYGYYNKYERSRDMGKRQFDGSFDSIQTTQRTSTNSWCNDESGCRSDPVIQRISERLANVTKIPTVNFEDFQMLKYEVGQFYRTHHDYIPHQRHRHCGPRILTFFLYLSDVEEGGGTGFPTLDIVIKPKKGRALLWPSVLNSNPSDKDHRTMHEARTVEAGTKYAANAWIHLYDYMNSCV